jgi:urease accessory protein
MIAGWRATLELRFAACGERTIVAAQRHIGPLLVQKTLHPADDPACHAIIVHPPGGIVGGDRLEISALAEAGSHALLTTPGATRWYRTAGLAAQQTVRLTGRAGSVLEWLPQETLYYEGCDAENRIDIVVEKGAHVIGWEIARLGRLNSSERFAAGRVRQSFTLHVGDEPHWVERGELQSRTRALASSVGLAAKSVFGTIVCYPVAGEMAQRLLSRLRGHTGAEGSHCGVTLLGECIVARYLGDSIEHARGQMVRWWSLMREELLRLPAIPPRIWRT